MTDASSLLIDPQRLQALLGESRSRLTITALAECESTNSLLLAAGNDGAPSGSVIVCDRQTHGRGSRGRRWFASPAASLTFSLLWRFDGGLERLSGLSLAVGLAVVRALDACGAHPLADPVALKWPNDIVHRGAKLGGILVELQVDDDGVRAIIGIGLNLLQPDNIDADEALALPVTALERILAAPPERHRLFAQLLIELAAVLDGFALYGFAPLRAAWQARNAWQDKPVRLLRDGRVEKEGVCRGADVDGALLVETGRGVERKIERCLSGDLSLRAS